MFLTHDELESRGRRSPCFAIVCLSCILAKCRVATGQNQSWSLIFMENGVVWSGGNGGGNRCEAVIGGARTEPMGSIDLRAALNRPLTA